MRLFITFLFFLAARCLTPISAQEVISMQSKTDGISVGATVGFLSFRDDIAHPRGAESGPGFGGHIQYGFNHKFSGLLAVQNYIVTAKSENKVDQTYPYLEVDVSAVFTFGSTNSQLRPMLSAGGTYTKMSESYYDFINGTGEINDEVYSGIGFVGGAGISYFMQQQLSIELIFQIHSGAFSKTLVNRLPVNVQHDYYTLNGLLGLSYHF
ncbi:MAG TPA: outer membrane beta-barrel protein [Saprospiraceae bacterium]|nr:outer membrane beta-barrel protein [Saprospiraceae bacterium]